MTRSRIAAGIAALAVASLAVVLGARPAVIVWHARGLDDPDPARRAAAARAVAGVGRASELARSRLRAARAAHPDEDAILEALAAVVSASERLELVAEALRDRVSLAFAGPFGRWPIQARVDGLPDVGAFARGWTQPFALDLRLLEVDPVRAVEVRLVLDEGRALAPAFVVEGDELRDHDVIELTMPADVPLGRVTLIAELRLLDGNGEPIGVGAFVDRRLRVPVATAIVVAETVSWR